MKTTWRINYLKQLFPVAVLEVIFLVFQILREFLRGSLLVRLCKFKCVRMFFKELKRNVNLPWQALSVLGLLILRRVEYRSARVCCAKDEKVMGVRTAWSPATYCDETCEIRAQLGRNSL